MTTLSAFQSTPWPTRMFLMPCTVLLLWRDTKLSPSSSSLSMCVRLANLCCDPTISTTSSSW